MLADARLKRLIEFDDGYWSGEFIVFYIQEEFASPQTSSEEEKQQQQKKEERIDNLLSPT